MSPSRTTVAAAGQDPSEPGRGVGAQRRGEPGLGELGLSLSWELLRPFLFALDAETAHELALAGLERLSSAPALLGLLNRALGVADGELSREVCGIRFANPLGLAAGCDKDGRAVRAFAALGFGHVEVGTVTPLPQPGNPRPRVFRLREDRAIINRLGFNSGGAAEVAARLAELRAAPGPGCVLGINLGRNRSTPAHQALEDYREALELLHAHGDYFVLNVSSPNTPGLRELQAEASLASLVSDVVALEAELAGRGAVRPRPILVKLAPDLGPEALDGAVDAAASAGAAGFIATNTTIERPPGLRGPGAGEAGGLSGEPLRLRSLAVVERLVRRLEGRLPVIAVGGIGCAAHARSFLEAGASLVQLYTGLVYGGPLTPRRILRGL